MPTHLTYLLGLVVVLGAVSAIAFSTSYQLVAWFRCALLGIRRIVVRRH